MLNIFGRRLRYGISVAALMAGTQAALLLNAYGGEGMAMVFSGAEPSIKIADSTTPSNDWDSAWGDGYSVQDFFKTRSFTSYTGPVSTGKRLMQADGYIKPCRHNLIPMSNRFGSAAWTRTAATSTYGQTDVDGGATASLITESNTSTSVLYNATAFTTAANVPYTISCKIKKGNSTWVRLAFGTSGGTFTNGVQQWYNLDTVATGTAATTGTASYISSSITATTNSYYILTLTASQASTTGAFIVSTATADASATRTTSGTYYICHAMCNSGSSVLDYVSSEAHNLCSRSQEFDNASWVKTTLAGVTANAVVAPDGTTTADRLLSSGSSTNQYVVMTHSSLTAGITYCASAYVKQDNYQYANMTIQSSLNGWQILVDLTDGSIQSVKAIGGSTLVDYGVVSVGNGWFQIWASGTATTATMYQTIQMANAATAPVNLDTAAFTGTGTDGLYAWGAAFELASSPGKYVATTSASVYNQHFDIPVEYNSDGTVKALTREEARTNLALYSNDQSVSTWSTSSTGLTSRTKNAVGISGVSNSATTVVTSSASANHYLGQAITWTAAIYTVYAIVKYVGQQWLQITTYDGTTTKYANFDIQNGVVGSNKSGVTSAITALGNSFYRIEITTSANQAAASGTITLDFIQTDKVGAHESYAPAGTESYVISHFQVEAGSTASSPIVTGSAAVTRAADVITIAKTVVPGTSTYTLYSKSLHHQTTAAYYGNMMVSSADSNNYMGIALYDYDVRAGAATSAVTQADMVGATNGWTAEVTHKVAARLSDNDSRAYLDGSAIAAADTSCTMPTAVYNIELGSRSAASHSTVDFYEVMVLPTGAVDATLATLTTA